MMEFVSWDDDLPNMMGKIIQMFQTFPNHQPVIKWSHIFSQPSQSMVELACHNFLKSPFPSGPKCQNPRLRDVEIVSIRSLCFGTLDLLFRGAQKINNIHFIDSPNGGFSIGKIKNHLNTNPRLSFTYYIIIYQTLLFTIVLPRIITSFRKHWWFVKQTQGTPERHRIGVSSISHHVPGLA